MTSRSIVALNNFSIEAIKDFMAQMADPICALHTSTHVLLFSLFLLKVVGGAGDYRSCHRVIQEVFQKSKKTLSGVRTTMETKTHAIYLFLICWIYLFFKSFYHNYN